MGINCYSAYFTGHNVKSLPSVTPPVTGRISLNTRGNLFPWWCHSGTRSVTPSIPISRNEIKELGRYGGGVKLARDFAIAQQSATEGLDHVRFLLRLAELELIERERRMAGRTFREPRSPAVKSLDSSDFLAFPPLNRALVLDLARSEYIARRENIIAVGNSGTGKTHIALGLGLAACQKGLSVGFITAAAVVHEMIEARDEKRLLRLQRQFAGYKLLIIDELGYVPLSQTGAELLFELFSQRYERGSTIVTSNLPFDEWTGVFASERLTGALLDRLTHHVHILEMNGESYRLNQSKQRARRANPKNPPTESTTP